LILSIETSTEICSVSISENGTLIDLREDLTGQNHSKLLTIFIDELLKKNGLAIHQFDAVAVSKGPGSYTGLRIGASVAKGLCYGAGVSLISVCPIEAMANHIINAQPEKGFELSTNDILVPMIDARRMEVYTGIWNPSGEMLEAVHAKIIDENSFEEYSQHRLVYFGNGSQKCENVFAGKNTVRIDGIYTSSAYMASLAQKKYSDGQFEDVAYFEPYYLKEFVTTVSSKKIF